MVGVDEVGRIPLVIWHVAAGHPRRAAAHRYWADSVPTAPQREKLFEIRAKALCFCIAEASPKRSTASTSRAGHAAGHAARRQRPAAPSPRSCRWTAIARLLPMPARAIVKGDAKGPRHLGRASILAKVTRDRQLPGPCTRPYPAYGCHPQGLPHRPSTWPAARARPQPLAPAQLCARAESRSNEPPFVSSCVTTRASCALARG